MVLLTKVKPAADPTRSVYLLPRSCGRFWSDAKQRTTKYKPNKGGLNGLKNRNSDEFTYDESGRMLSAESQCYSNEVGYSYDQAGRKATESLEIAGQTYTTTINYNELGQISGYVYPDGTTVGRSYTDRGQLETIERNNVTTIDTRTYDDGGRMLTSNYNNGVGEIRAYNNDNSWINSIRMELIGGTRRRQRSWLIGSQQVVQLQATWELR